MLCTGQAFEKSLPPYIYFNVHIYIYFAALYIKPPAQWIRNEDNWIIYKQM